MLFDDSLVNKFDEIGNIDFINDEINSNDLSTIIALPIKKGKYIIQEVHIDKPNDTDLIRIELKFIKTEKGYRFYGYDRYG